MQTRWASNLSNTVSSCSNYQGSIVIYCSWFSKHGKDNFQPNVIRTKTKSALETNNLANWKKRGHNFATLRKFLLNFPAAQSSCGHIRCSLHTVQLRCNIQRNFLDRFCGPNENTLFFAYPSAFRTYRYLHLSSTRREKLLHFLACNTAKKIHTTSKLFLGPFFALCLICISLTTRHPL